MASAVLASRNEAYFGERKVYMRKNPAAATAAAAAAAAAAQNQKINPPVPPHPNLNPNPNQRTGFSKAGKQVQIHGAPADQHRLYSIHFQQEKAAPPAMGKPVNLGEAAKSSADCFTFSLGGRSRNELKQLKRQLISELQLVRVLSARLETLNPITRSAYKPPPPPPPPPPPLLPPPLSQQPSLPVSTPKPASQPKKKGGGAGSKRSNPGPTGQEPGPKRPALDLSMEKVLTGMMKRCRQMLTKLMKHKFGWVFNQPVDAKAMNLFDYHQIIKQPMDLGTVKSNLDKAVYKSPVEFAADVRLTFGNAMVYNPKNHNVHIMAEKLLNIFNEMFDPANNNFEKEKAKVCGSNSNLPPMVLQPASQQQLPASAAKQGSAGEKGKAGKLPPKPKARDVNKRQMSFEEKEKLSEELTELPEEKLMQLWQMLNKKNGRNLADDAVEIEFELDMEAMDNETLWELDRFVCNYKKSAQKIKRQDQGPLVHRNDSSITTAAVAATPVAAHINQQQFPVREMEEEPKVGEDDVVDIGEDIPVGNFPPVEIQRDTNVTGAASGGRSSSSSSSSSGSDSSSSSGSDSGSSSGSDSDADSVQSPYVQGNEVDILT